MNISKKALIVSVIVTLFVATLGITPSFAQTTATIKVYPPIILDPTLEPCSVFTIEIMVQDVEDLWGFEFYITWNPDVLTCIGGFPVVPFVIPWPSEIGWGYAKIAASLMLGLDYGVAGDYVLAYLNFHVKAYCSTFLDLEDTILTPWYATPPIEHTVQDGYFSNHKELRYKVDLKRAYAEHTNWIAAEDLDNTLTAVVRNFGLTTRADVTITIEDELAMWSISYSERVELAKRERKVVTRNLLRTDLPGPGTYYVTNSVLYYDVDAGTWLPAVHQKIYSFTLI